VSTHISDEREKSRAFPIVGNATLTIVASTSVMKNAATVIPSTHHRRGSRAWLFIAGGAGPSWSPSARPFCFSLSVAFRSTGGRPLDVRGEHLVLDRLHVPRREALVHLVDGGLGPGRNLLRCHTLRSFPLAELGRPPSRGVSQSHHATTTGLQPGGSLRRAAV